jgi:hypothetical protein
MANAFNARRNTSSSMTHLFAEWIDQCQEVSTVGFALRHVGTTGVSQNNSARLLGRVNGHG